MRDLLNGVNIVLDEGVKDIAIKGVRRSDDHVQRGVVDCEPS